MMKKYSIIFIIAIISTIVTSGALTFLNSRHSSFDSPYIKWLIVLFVLLVFQVATIIFIYVKYIKKET